MLIFALFAALISAAAAGLVLWRAARAPQAPAEAPEAAVYARQIAELDEQKARGLMDEEGWRAARAEAGRRLLGAAAKASEGGDEQGSPRDRLIVTAAAVGAVALAGVVYLAVGRPGRADEPFAVRLAEWRKAPETLGPEEMAAVLEAELVKRPGDPVLLSYLGKAYSASGKYVNAAGAFERLTRVRPQDARAWAALGEMRMAENDGKIGPDVRAAFDEALKLDPKSPAPLWWLGRDDVLAGRKDEGLARWKTALAGLAADDSRRAEIEAAVAQVQGGQFETAQAVAEAAPQDQAAMIRGMVEGLAQRLERGGGTAAEWAKLVRAYTVLGDQAARDKALAKARSQFAGKPDDLRLIDAAAGAAPAGR